MASKRRPMAPRQFRIGELASLLGLEDYTIRFWEKEFEIASTRSPGGQRFYTNEDAAMFSLIKELLYEKGFTIPGAKQQIAERQKAKATPVVKHNFLGAARATQGNSCDSCKNTEALKKELRELSLQLDHLKKQLKPSQMAH